METNSYSRMHAAVCLLLGLWLSPVLAAVSSTVQSAEASAPSFPWPMQFSAGSEIGIIYPPELDGVRNGVAEGSFAIAVRAGEDARPRFGVVRFQARVQSVDWNSAAVSAFQLSTLEFPSEPARAEELLGQVRTVLSGVTWRTSNRRLQDAIAATRAQSRARSVPPRNDVPRIMVSERPAVVVAVDGAPVLRDVPGSSLRRITNTRALILFEPASSRYYTLIQGNWYNAERIDGPWNLTVNLSSEVESVGGQLTKTETFDLVAPPSDSGDSESEAAPFPVVSTVPAALIVTQGYAQWGAITGTSLLYLTNSAASVFYDLHGQSYYVALSGRWYRSMVFPDGQWEYVDADRLPADFAQLPQGHPMEPVRAAVPGTPEAREAHIAATVPETTVVQRSKALVGLAYDGPPRFAPVPGTNLESAVNANLPVIRVSAYAYYALQDGVWFTSISGVDGWKVADSVPPEIYAIPPSAPLHSVTYARVYDATPTDVYVGYTPGYLGWYAAGATVVYGTGWYRPWIGSPFYPAAWGCGCCANWWQPWYGWGPCPVFGWVRPWRAVPVPVYRPRSYVGTWYPHVGGVAAVPMVTRPAPIAPSGWHAPPVVAPAQRTWHAPLAAAQAPSGWHAPPAAASVPRAYLHVPVNRPAIHPQPGGHAYAGVPAHSGGRGGSRGSGGRGHR